MSIYLNKLLGTVAKMSADYFARVQNTPSYEGIKISAFPKYNQENNYQIVAKSLKLIETVSPVSYNRVKKHINIIFLCDLRKGQSKYYYNQKCLCVSKHNIEKAFFPNKAIVQLMAYWLIYSSAYGAIMAKGLVHSSIIVKRINKCCDKAGCRFMERLMKKVNEKQRTDQQIN